VNNQRPYDKNEDNLNRIFAILDEFRKEFGDLKAQTKSLADQIDNMNLVIKEQDIRLNNLEYKLECEELGPDQPEGQVEHFTNFDQNCTSNVANQRPPGTYNHGQQRYDTSYEFNVEDINIPSPEHQLHVLQQKNEGLENKLNEVMEVLNQIRNGSDAAQ